MHNIITEQETRYKFVSKIVTGKVLDVSYGKSMAYHSANILLNGGVKEVWNYDVYDKNIDVRKYDNMCIKFQNHNENILDEKFDSIILFEWEDSINDISSYIKKFSKLLNIHGIFVISVFNHESHEMNHFYKKNSNVLTKNQLEIILHEVFLDITFYSQLISSKRDALNLFLHYCSSIKQLFRNILRTIILIFDKDSTFYKIRLQKTISKIDKSVDRVHDKIFDKDLDPVLFEKNHNPVYFIVICKIQKLDNC